MRRRLSALLVPVFVAFALLTAACGDDSGAAAGVAPPGSTGSTVAGDTTAPPSTESADPVTLHLAYFANITMGLRSWASATAPTRRLWAPTSS